MNTEELEIIDEEWWATTHEIVKYKPEFYNEEGHYVTDEWTSMSDVGKICDGHIVTLEEYLEVEQRYVDAVIRVMNLTNCKYLTVSLLRDTAGSTKRSILQMQSKKNRFLQYDKLLYNSYMELVNGKRIHISDIDKVVRLNLREYTDTELTNKKMDFKFISDMIIICILTPNFL